MMDHFEIEAMQHIYDKAGRNSLDELYALVLADLFRVSAEERPRIMRLFYVASIRTHDFGVAQLNAMPSIIEAKAREALAKLNKEYGL